LPLDPQTGAELVSWRRAPSALLKPPSATGASAGQKAVATPTVFLPADVEALTIVNLLSVDADEERQLTNATNCCA
jgi:hypothetical protein